MDRTVTLRDGGVVPLLMPHADFVHLRVHSAYSLSEGAIKADRIAALAADAGDAGGGDHRHRQPVRRAGVQPGLRGAAACSRSSAARSRSRAHDNPRLPPDPLVLLAQDATGLANLQRLSSAGFLETEPGLKPQLALDRIAEHAERPDPAHRRQRRSDRAAARRRPEARGRSVCWRALAEAFPDRTAMELHRHGRPVERAIEPGLIALADAARRAAGRHQRVLLRRARDARGARCAALHRRGPPAGRDRAPARDAGALVQAGARRCARCSPTCRKPATTRSRSRGAAR